MPREASDRNLLFGILAVQMDFISRDALVNAMHAWVLKKARPLGQILLEQNALTSETHALLEALVQKHLALHGNDPQQSLAAVSSVGSVKKHLEQIADPDVQASMIALSSPAKEREAGGAAAELDDLYATVSIGAPTATGQRFRILRPHAKGGLGEVFVAHDEELHREVALKEIQDRHADNQESRARFMLEAEITGGLEHPGIVPVYGLGQYADGRPFYAMRFIRGDSLQDAIEKFHNPPPSPRGRGAGGEGERQREFRQLLGRFIDVCQAMQYAHDRGVLHRDLKPGNIMLGRYGETLVVDWGLAKATTKPDPELQRGGAESPLRPASASGSAETIAGSTIGTPAYMSPEQAAGRLDQLGPASDVYSLGATLYVLLTGKPSIEDRDIGVVLKKVQSGDIRRPRQHKPAVSPALEAICLKAIALNPGDRYATPKALADDVEKWLADEPVSAAPEPVLVRARRWMRKHPAAVSGIAAAVLVGVVSLAALAVVLGAKNAEMESANTTIAAKNTALKDANAAIGKANDDLKKSVAAETAARQEAQTNEKLAAEQRTLALQTLRLVVDDIDVQLKNKPAMQELRQKLLDKALEGLKKVARSADNSKAIDHHTVWAHFELGDLFLNLAGAGVEQAHKQYERAHAIAAQRVDVESEDSQAQRDLAISFNKLGDVSLQLGQVQTAKGYFQDSLAIGKKRADDDPKDSKAQRDLSVSFTKLGDVSLQLGQVPAAQGYYQDSLAIHKKLADADPKDIQAQRDLAISFNNLGDVSLRLGQTQAAQGYYQDSLAIFKKRADADPKDLTAQAALAVFHFKLATTAVELPDHTQARESFAEALKVLEGPQKLGMLKGTIYAGWPQFLEYRVAVCRRVEEAVADLNTALKYPPETTRELLLLRAKELARMKKLDDAAATTEYLAGLKDALGEAQFAAARAHGYMAGVADALPAKHTEQALKLLHAARASGCFDLPVNRKQLETHRDFEPFRKNADFTKLLAEIDADTGKLVLEMKADLLTTDPKDRALKESPSQVHEIKLTAGKRYAVALDRVGGGKFDPFLRLEDAERKELTRDDDSGGDLNSFLVFIPAETATYRLIVTSFDGSTGTYVLSVRERAGK